MTINRAAWDAVGPVDEGFPMYYEDSEWCYRARLLGYKILPAPQAVIYHAFGGKVPSGDVDTLSPTKLRNVVYGRYRFVIKLNGETLFRFLRNYWVEDWANFLVDQTRWKMAGSYIKVGRRHQKLPELRATAAPFQAQPDGC
jgi:GT2 family glycosyltransferase